MPGELICVRFVTREQYERHKDELADITERYEAEVRRVLGDPMELIKPTGNQKLDEERRELWIAVLLKGVDEDPHGIAYTWAQLAVRADEAVAEFDARFAGGRHD